MLSLKQPCSLEDINIKRLLFIFRSALSGSNATTQPTNSPCGTVTSSGIKTVNILIDRVMFFKKKEWKCWSFLCLCLSHSISQTSHYGSTFLLAKSGQETYVCVSWMMRSVQCANVSTAGRTLYVKSYLLFILRPLGSNAAGKSCLSVQLQMCELSETSFHPH